MASDIVAIKSFAMGETIYREGEVGRTVFLVREGLVRIARERSSTSKQPLGHAGPGQVFGEHALLSAGPRPNSAIAEKTTTCVVINRDKLAERLKTEDAFVAALFNILSTNMRSMIDQGSDPKTLEQDLKDGARTLEEAVTPPKPSTVNPPVAKASGGKSAPPEVEGDDDDDAFLI